MHSRQEKDQPGRRLAGGLLLLYEDQYLVVVDKPAGLLSIASGTEREKTAYWILAEYLRRKGEKRRPAAVHRLDRDTSGLMVFAKSERIKKRLMEHWNSAVVKRRYIALAEGEFFREKADEGIIDAPLGEDGGGRVVVRPGGKEARTWWKLLARGRGYSLLSLELETGRRNQIRAHLFFLGYPVAGDKKYGAKTNPLGRLALHAEALSFYHPVSGELLEFLSPGFSGRVKRWMGIPQGIVSDFLKPGGPVDQAYSR
jgi:23S rRNA pseudouridine1911/1915/1917 synthase